MASKRTSSQRDSNNRSYYQSCNLAYADGFQFSTILDLHTINRLSTDAGPALMDEIRKNMTEANNGLTTAGNDKPVTEETALPDKPTDLTEAGPSVQMVESSDRPTADYKVWTDNETKALFNIRSSMEAEFQKSKAHSTLWNRISRKLGESGLTASSENCKTKWKALKQQYRKTVDHNHQTGAEPRTCKFLDQFNELYGNRSGTHPIATNSSMTSAQQGSEIETPKAGKKRKARSPVKSPTMQWLRLYQQETSEWREQQAARQKKRTRG